MHTADKTKNINNFLGQGFSSQVLRLDIMVTEKQEHFYLRFIFSFSFKGGRSSPPRSVSQGSPSPLKAGFAFVVLCRKTRRGKFVFSVRIQSSPATIPEYPATI